VLTSLLIEINLVGRLEWHGTRTAVTAIQSAILLLVLSADVVPYLRLHLDGKMQPAGPYTRRQSVYSASLGVVGIESNISREASDT
jgi:hypothetical protein